MNFCCYLFFVFNLILFTNLVKSKLRHIKVTHKNGVKTYVVNRQRFGTFKDAYKYSKIKRNSLKNTKSLRKLVKKPIKSSIIRLRKKPIKKITKLSISRRNGKNVKEKKIRTIEPVVIMPKSLVTVSPIIKSANKSIKKITKELTSTTTSENITETTINKIKSTVTTSTSTESPTTTTTTISTESPTTTTTTVTEDENAKRLATLYNSIDNYRKKYKVQSLQINNKLEIKAEDCVLKYERDNKSWESEDPQFGLNFGSNAWDPNDAVDYWDSNKKYYNYDKPVSNPYNLDYVILAWKSATDIGCSLGPGYNYRICCVFYKMGNLDDEKTLRDNVLRP
uniref:SCP domain-containing protein n=2 Tax=Strongyloides stercoralis TaxID=6248 RepID=A0AAF5DQ39_STRER